jgi:hypothetical protein
LTLQSHTPVANSLLPLQSGADNSTDIQVLSDDNNDTASIASSKDELLKSVTTHSDKSVSAGTTVVATVAADADTAVAKESRRSVSYNENPYQAMIQYILTRLKLIPNTPIAAAAASNDTDSIRYTTAHIYIL